MHVAILTAVIREHRKAFTPEQRKAGFWLTVDNRAGVWEIVSGVDRFKEWVPAFVFVRPHMQARKLALDLITQLNVHAA